MNRMRFLSAAAMLLTISGLLAGCGGGGGGDNSSDGAFDNPTGTINSLGNVSVQPFPFQSGFISRGTNLVISWPSLGAAPRSFTADLWRYKEGRGGEDREEYRESIRAEQPNNSVAQYTVRRRDGQLDESGVYFLELGSPAEVRTYAFVVTSPPRSVPTRAVNISNPGGTGDLNNLIFRWTDDLNGSADIPTNTQFRLEFPSESAAPSNFAVRIGRWKEKRGSDDISYNEQPAEFSHTAGTGVWTVRRRDGFALEQGGTYIIEITGGALTEPLRYAFIVRR